MRVARERGGIGFLSALVALQGSLTSRAGLHIVPATWANVSLDESPPMELVSRGCMSLRSWAHFGPGEYGRQVAGWADFGGYR